MRLERAQRIWSIRFAAFCLLYWFLFRSDMASDAIEAVLNGLNRIGGAWAFVLAPFLAVAGASRALTGRANLLLALGGGAVLAFLCLTGETLALEFTLIAALAFLGAMLSYLLAGLALLAMAMGAGVAGSAGGASVLGPLGDVLAALTGQSVAANLMIVVGAVLIPLLAPRMSDWLS